MPPNVTYLNNFVNYIRSFTSPVFSKIYVRVAGQPARGAGVVEDLVNGLITSWE